MTDTRQALAALQRLESLIDGGMGGIVFNTSAAGRAKAGEVSADIAMIRAALSAQPVAGAVAEPVVWKIITVGGRTLFEEQPPETCYSAEWLERCKLVQPLVPQAQAAPAPAPSARPVLPDARELPPDWAVAHEIAYRWGWKNGIAAFTRQPAQPVATAKPSAQAVAKELAGWKDEAESLRRERDYYRERSQMMYEHQRKECWYWQGDGEDHLESLVGSLPVVILARDLRAMLAASPQPEPSAQYKEVGFFIRYSGRYATGDFVGEIQAKYGLNEGDKLYKVIK